MTKGAVAMVIEHVELAILPGREAEFETAMNRGSSMLAGAAGCTSVSLARGVERPSRYLLQLQSRSPNHCQDRDRPCLTS